MILEDLQILLEVYLMQDAIQYSNQIQPNIYTK
jgi:hypothetical protein